MFALELTHDVNMMLPLLIAVAIAHAFTVLALRRSILTEKVGRRGFHLSREYATDPLEILFVREVMDTNGIPAETMEARGVVAYPDEPLTAVVNRMATTGHTSMLVVAREDATEVAGWISLHHLLEARVRHLEEERRREGAVRLSRFIPRWIGTSAEYPAAR